MRCINDHLLSHLYISKIRARTKTAASTPPVMSVKGGIQRVARLKKIKNLAITVRETF